MDRGAAAVQAEAWALFMKWHKVRRGMAAEPQRCTQVEAWALFMKWHKERRGMGSGTAEVHSG